MINLKTVLKEACPARSKEWYSRVSISGGKDLNKMLGGQADVCLVMVSNMTGLLDDEIVAEFTEFGTFNDHVDKFVASVNEALPAGYRCSVKSIFGASYVSRGTVAFFEIVKTK